MILLQASGLARAKLDAPEAYRFSCDDYASLSQKIFDVTVTEIEAIGEPDSIRIDIWRESVTSVGVHGLILAKISDLSWQHLASSSSGRQPLSPGLAKRVLIARRMSANSYR